jgi:hypothetical protein
MSSLFSPSMPSMPTVQPAYQAASADMASENAALFERIQRSRAYGPQQTRLVPNVKGTLGG